MDTTILEKLKSKEYQEYFNLFGEEVGIKLLCYKSITINKMIENNQTKLMYYWYQKTGCKYIPDYVVMQNIEKEEIDKFLKNDKAWSRLMQIEEFNKLEEGKIALLKLGFIYGIFSGNKNSINQLEFLLKGIPLKLSKENFELLIQIEDRIKNAENIVFPTKDEINDYNELKEELEKNKIIKINSEYIFKELYKKEKDNIYKLKFNYQSYPNILSKIRKFMETWGIESILNPFNTYKIVKDFELEYDDDFRKFFIENIEFFLINYDYSIYLSKIQNQFKEIKRINRNKKIPLEFAINYVKECDYDNINVGNDKLADTIGKIGIYNQSHFEILQKMYNYGKIRVYSSIPRIKGIYNEYTYEMLRLDDPLALVIGNITDCCQILNNNGEACMEHSMIDDNGRIFIVKDKEGKIVAQSWVWRNKNIICFDDIELSTKLFIKEERASKRLLARYLLAEKIFEVYEEASKRLMEIDNTIYFNMLLKKQISKKQYYGLKLNKVIIGLGKHEIANVILNKLKPLETTHIKPLPFIPKVELKVYPELYLRDSIRQYVIEDNNEYYNFDLDNLIIYNDEYEVYTNKNTTKIELNILESLRKNTYQIDTNLLEENEYKENFIVSSIAMKYKLDIENTKLIIHPNFAIIYEEQEEIINIIDIYKNTKIDNYDQQIDISSIVNNQINLALLQISQNKILNYNKLENRIAKKVLVK